MFELHKQFQLLPTLKEVSYAQALEFSAGIFAMNGESRFLRCAAASEEMGETEVLSFSRFALLINRC